MISETLKRLAVPCLLDTFLSKRNLVSLFLIKSARNHDHVSTDITTESSALTGIKRFLYQPFAKVYCSRNITAIHTNLALHYTIFYSMALRIFFSIASSNTSNSQIFTSFKSIISYRIYTFRQ